MHDSWDVAGAGCGGGTLAELPPLSLDDPPSVLLSSKTPTLPTFQNAHPLIQMVSPYLLYTYPDKVPETFFLTHLLILRVGSLQPEQHRHDTLKAKSRSTWVPVSKRKQKTGKALQPTHSCQCLLEQEHYPHRAEGTCHQGHTCGLVLAHRSQRRL